MVLERLTSLDLDMSGGQCPPWLHEAEDDRMSDEWFFAAVNR